MLLMPDQKPTLDYARRDASEEGERWGIVVLATIWGIIVFFLLVAFLLPLTGILR
jgi:hypothetical protein